MAKKTGEQPLVDKNYRLQKYPGKGGWTYVVIQEIASGNKARFGYVKVKGTIDGFPISKYHLMPMRGGGLFLPVRAEIRKKIKKEEGALVHVVLYPDTEPLELPDEMLQCLKEEPEALRFFNGLTESERKYYIQWVYSAKKEETKIDRLAKTINKLLKKQKLYEMDK